MFSAFAAAQVAKWRLKQATMNAHHDAVFLAQVDGTTPPHDPGISDPSPLTPEGLINAVSALVTDRLAEDQERLNAEYAATVYGDGVTHEQIIAAEQQAEADRRRELAKPAHASIPADQLTDAQRQAMGLPSRTATSGGEPRCAAPS